MKTIKVIATNRETGDQHIKTICGEEVKKMYKQALHFIGRYCHTKYENTDIEFESMEDKAEATH